MIHHPPPIPLVCMQCGVCLGFQSSVTVLRCGHPVCSVCFDGLMHPDWWREGDPLPNPPCPSCQVELVDTTDTPPPERGGLVRQLSPWNVGEIEEVSPQDIGLVKLLKRICCNLYRVSKQASICLSVCHGVGLPNTNLLYDMDGSGMVWYDQRGRIFKCGCEGCPEQLADESLDSHMDTCLYREVQCGMRGYTTPAGTQLTTCRARITLGQLAHHLATGCVYQPCDKAPLLCEYRSLPGLAHQDHEACLQYMHGTSSAISLALASDLIDRIG
jgi:hypothetical protein